jgi:nucleoside-diphosphate-sugar epimerase
MVLFIGGFRLFKAASERFSGHYVSLEKFIGNPESYANYKVAVFCASPALSYIRYGRDLAELELYASRFSSLDHFDKLIFVSSVGVYEKTSSGDAISVNDDIAISDIYNSEKLNLENMFLSMHYSGRIPDLKILRVSGLYSVDPRFRSKHNLIDNILNSIRDESLFSPVIYNSGTQLRDFCSLDFILDILSFFVSSKVDGVIFNVSSTHPVRIKELFDWCVESKSVSPRYVHSDDSAIHCWVNTDKLRNVYSFNKINVIDDLTRACGMLDGMD